ncbi:MAG: DoxX family protein [Planctomycetota bacterium]
MLDRILPRFEGVAYALLRVVTGVLLAMHGTQKLFGWFRTGPGPELGSQMWIGGVIELVGGTLIAVGLFTRWAAFVCSGMMAVAYVQFHWKLAFDGSFFPIVNRGELALTFALVFLFIACRGPGAPSVDGSLRK